MGSLYARPRGPEFLVGVADGLEVVVVKVAEVDFVVEKVVAFEVDDDFDVVDVGLGAVEVLVLRVVEVEVGLEVVAGFEVVLVRRAVVVFKVILVARRVLEVVTFFDVDITFLLVLVGFLVVVKPKAIPKAHRKRTKDWTRMAERLEA